MPVTPFHLGPGALFKSAVPSRVSFLTFVLAQGVIDLESLYFLTRGEWPVHRFLHTYLGAALLAVMLFYAGRPLLNWLLARTLPHLPVSFADFWELDTPITTRSAAWGAFLGTFSHVAFDSVMHADMRPLAPFSEGNGMLEVIPLGALHLACLGAALLGVTGFALRRALRQPR